MKNSNRKYLLGILLLFLFVLLIPGINSNQSNSAFIHLSFLFIGVFSTLALMHESVEAPFSCRTFHWVFSIFFFFLSPYLQYLFHTWPLNYVPTEEEILKTNLQIILWITVFHFSRSLLYDRGSLIFRKHEIEQLRERYSEDHKPASWQRPVRNVTSDHVMFLLLTVSFLLDLVLISRVGLKNLVSSRFSGQFAYKSSSAAVSSILTYCVRNFVSFTAFFSCYRFQKKQQSKLVLAISLLLLLIGCSPLGIPRYQAATIYMTVFLLLFPNWKYKITFVILFIVLFMFAFPLLDNFRYQSSTDEGIGEQIVQVLQNVQNEYLTANYDAYIMIIKTRDYVASFGYRNGLQLLGALLFFVPRSIWATKPVSTGTLIQQMTGAHMSAFNVSSSLISEAIVDFGNIGIVLYAIVFAMICNGVDFRIKIKERAESVDGILYLLIPPLVFFLIRGSLLSVWAFLCSYLVIGKAMIWLSKRIA